jgi:uncharacterized membrane protein
MIEVVLTLLVVAQVVTAWKLWLAKRGILALFGIISSLLDVITTMNKIDILKKMETDVNDIEQEFRRIIDSL